MFRTGRGPGSLGATRALPLLEAWQQIAAIARVSGVGGAQGRDLYVWRDGTSRGRYCVGPWEHIGRGGILAETLTEALALRDEAVEAGCWPESQRLVIWHSHQGGLRASKPIGGREAKGILEQEAQSSHAKAKGL